MRADRLLSILMILQTRGRASAAELAKELEVSVRTIYRDLDALGAAGIPVFAESGRHGGYELLDGYRTRLTGLSCGEARALSMLNLPSPLSDLEMSRDLKSALLKLSAALPGEQAAIGASLQRRYHIDSTPWRHPRDAIQHLTILERAIQGNYRLQITYHSLAGVEITRQADPYGLVSKAGVWYLVYARAKSVRAHRLADLLEVHLTDEIFQFPDHFDLAEFWNAWCSRREQSFSAYYVRVRVYPRFFPALPRYFGESMQARIQNSVLDAENDSIILDLSFESLEAAREQILAFGSGVEVIEPEALRISLVDYARQTLSRYSDG